MSWLTFADVQARIAAWAEHQKSGFRAEDAMLDAHLYFLEKSPALATLDLSSLKIDKGADEAGRTGDIYGRWDRFDTVLQLAASPPEGDGQLVEGRWYYHGKQLDVSPRDLASFREALTKGQQKNFDRRLKNVRSDERPLVLALLWETRYGHRNGLVVLISPDGEGGVKAESLELAPTDVAVRKFRAGPDIEGLHSRRIVIFGVGAIGSNVASRLVEAGLGQLTLVDGGKLRPGDVVRHAADFGIGQSKVGATKIHLLARAPWSSVSPIVESPWSPDRLAELIEGADLVIEMTGLATFAELLSRVARRARIPFVSAALYRGGSVARIRRQRAEGDTPLIDRTDEERFLLIPPGAEPISLEPGCDAPVNNASPVAVAAIAATVAEIVIDLLTDRLLFGEEVIDVYRPLETEPFSRIGRVCG
jgi:molybdopterin/thiamine biosynthesis adenylyltransferase